MFYRFKLFHCFLLNLWREKRFQKKITLRALPHKWFMELLDSLLQNTVKSRQNRNWYSIQVLSFFHHEKNYSFNVSINEKIQNLFFVFAFLMLTETVLCLCSCIRKWHLSWFRFIQLHSNNFINLVSCKNSIMFIFRYKKVAFILKQFHLITLQQLYSTGIIF